MAILETLKLIILFLALFVCLTFFFLSIFQNLIAAPFVPTSNKTSRKMIEAAELDEKDIVYDLGSGDGRLIFMAAAKGVTQAIGYEINPHLIIFSKLKQLVLRSKNTAFHYKSFWKADLSNATKIFVYLLPRTMNKLERKILSEVKPGTLIISHDFSLHGFELVHEKEKGVKVYRVPEKQYNA